MPILTPEPGQTEPVYFEDWVVGHVYETEGRTITRADVDHFNQVEGYASKLHNADAADGASVFDRVTVHGLVTLVIASGLMSASGMFETTGLASLGVTWNYKAPAYVGDALRVRWWIGSKRLTSKAGRGLVVREVEVINQRDEIICTGELKALWACRDGA